MLRHVALIRTVVSEELSASETSVLTRSALPNIPEDVILHSHRRKNTNLTKVELFSLEFRTFFTINVFSSMGFLIVNYEEGILE
jgi:hypothetical protein